MSGASVTRSLSGEGWAVDLRDVQVEIPGHPLFTGEAYEADFLFRADSAITVILGKTVWEGGALVLDFVNRHVRFEPAAP